MRFGISDGGSRVMFDYEIPMIFGVLTTETTEQALAGAEGNKGEYVDDAITTMIEIVLQV